MFAAVFSIFVLAVVVLSVLTVRWAIRRDRAGRSTAVHPGDRDP
ncbi:MAG: hypothetical protein WA786_10490 [Acidimicrobiales bacterium]